MNGCIASSKKAPYAEIIGILAPAGGKNMYSNDGKPILEVSNSDDFFNCNFYSVHFTDKKWFKMYLKCKKYFKI